jgi:hypothetical protein
VCARVSRYAPRTRTRWAARGPRDRAGASRSRSAHALSRASASLGPTFVSPRTRGRARWSSAFRRQRPVPPRRRRRRFVVSAPCRRAAADARPVASRCRGRARRWVRLSCRRARAGERVGRRRFVVSAPSRRRAAMVPRASRTCARRLSKRVRSCGDSMLRPADSAMHYLFTEHLSRVTSGWPMGWDSGRALRSMRETSGSHPHPDLKAVPRPPPTR